MIPFVLEDLQRFCSTYNLTADIQWACPPEWHSHTMTHICFHRPMLIIRRWVFFGIFPKTILSWRTDRDMPSFETITQNIESIVRNLEIKSKVKAGAKP